MALIPHETSTMGPETAAQVLAVTKPVPSTIPKKRQDLLKWNGWGYQDSKFEVIADKEQIYFTGDRYTIGNQALPHFYDWVKNTFDVNVKDPKQRACSKPYPGASEIPVGKSNSDFESVLRQSGISFSRDGHDRLIRCHGHALHDIVYLRELNYAAQPLPDMVIWPTNHDQVVTVVEAAKAHDVVIIPFGGGTSVSWAVAMPRNENRLLAVLDTSQMNRLLWLDEDNLVACYESGIVGQDLERNLNTQGYTSGHEPDSYEFSSLGGWVATRASGMKKNVYGNIEDIVVSARMVTPRGILHKRTQAPRISAGPDFNHVILGSEGTLGVVTEVAIKIRPLPPCRKYGSIVFGDFETGFKLMREVALRRCQPASIRLIDNEQFKFGQALRPQPNIFGVFLDGLKKAYITKIKGFDPNKMCVATLLFEGEASEVALQEQRVYEIAKRVGGIPAGETNGKRGYTLTFVIAYIRDLALDFSIAAESFETSVPWDRALALIRNVKHRLNEACDRRGIKHRLISARVTQTYDVGCCIYFYFGFKFLGLPNPLQTYHELEVLARDEILAAGGSVSHHHGIGKVRARWYPQQVSSMGVELYKWTKSHLDPNNIFGNGNLIPRDEQLTKNKQEQTPRSKL